MGFSDVISLSVHVGRLISIPFGQKCSAILTNKSNTEGTPVINMFLFISLFFFFFFLFIIIFPKVSHDLWGHGFFLGVSLLSEGLVPIRRAEAGQLRQQGGKGGRGASPADWGRQRFPSFAPLQLISLSFPWTWSFLLLFFFIISILLFHKFWLSESSLWLYF